MKDKIKRKITIILSKSDWESVLEGATKSIRLYRESELHHYFGDHPEENIVRAEIREV